MKEHFLLLDFPVPAMFGAFTASFVILRVLLLERLPHQTSCSSEPLQQHSFSVLLNALLADINLLPPPKEVAELKFVPYSGVHFHIHLHVHFHIHSPPVP